MASSKFVGQHYPAIPTEGRDAGQDSRMTGWSTKSVRGDLSLEARLQPKAAHRPFTSVSTALVLASLIVAYLLLACYRHLSRGPLMGDAQRILASNLPDENDKGCVDTPEDGDGGEPSASHPPPKLGGWMIPPMPEEVQQMMAGALRMLAEVAARVKSLSHFLTRFQTRSLVYRVTKIAALELSGFAFLPPVLQPLRKWVAKEYLGLSSSLLKMYPTGSSSHRISKLLDHHANLNILKVLRDLQLSVEPGTNYVPTWRHELALSILEGVYQARLRQIAGQFFTRYWLAVRQSQARDAFFFSKNFAIKAINEGTLSLAADLKRITSAVASSGGKPVQLHPYLDAEFDTADNGLLPADTPGAGNHGLPYAGRAGAGVGAAGRAGSALPHVMHSATGIAAPFPSGAHRPPLPASSHFPLTTLQSFTRSSPPELSSLQKLATAEGEKQQQAGFGDTGSGDGTAGAHRDLQGASTSSAPALTSEDGVGRGRTGQKDEESDDLLKLIQASLDWSTAFDEEGYGH
ncbi:hypothetical protein Emag_003014 [Eimeria magna]